MMITFWIIAAMLLVVALAFVIAPLMRRGGQDDDVDREQLNVEIYKDKLAELDFDLNAGTINEDQHKKAAADLKRSLLSDIEGKDEAKTETAQPQNNFNLAIVLAVAIPIFSVGIYTMIGTNVDEVIAKRDARDSQVAGHQGMSMDDMVAQIKQRVETEPGNPEAWEMLARVYAFQKQPEKAEQAYKQGIDKTGGSVQLKGSYANFLTQNQRVDEAIKLLEGIIEQYGETNADVLAHYADALAVKQGGLQGKPYEVVKKAVEIQPFHPKSLWLAGTAAFNARDFQTAIKYWQKLRQTVDPKSEDAKTIEANLNQARQLLAQEGGGSPPVDEAGSSTSEATGGSSVISGTVKLAPNLAAQANPNDVIYLFARAINGPRMPLAVAKYQVKDLPITFRLDENNAMNQDLTLARAKEVVVTARVAKSGDVLEQPGDLFGKQQNVKVGASDIHIEINQVVGQKTSQTARPPVQQQAQQQQTSSSALNAAVSGVVKLSPDIAGKVSPSDTLFVYAKAANGPPMPLAVLKKQAKDLPLKFTLDDSLAMAPMAKLSNYSDVVITALVSKSGTAKQTSGDLKGVTPVVKVGSNELEINIDSVVP